MLGIHLLENHIINKIAAGEVVERPSSVVKELVENSIDAGAKSITIEVNGGGVDMIRITDNGSGIPKSEVKQAFLRHATSKLSDISDLENLLTLGFRGEALSSISSVSQVEIITKTADEITGVRIEIHGGQIISEQEIGCADGTTFIMRNLFFNTPARRKFLKKPGVESGYISDIITKLALGHPEIAFKYINNTTPIIQTRGNGDLKTAILNVYGKDVAQKILPVEYRVGDYHLQGYIGKPEISRANRSYENFFINGRFIKSTLLNSAVEETYKTRLMTGKFPLFALDLKMLPANVDVNVHPTKLEVRFSDEDEIYSFVLRAVEKAFKNEILIPSISLDNRGSKPAQKYYGSNKDYAPKENKKQFIDVYSEKTAIKQVPADTSDRQAASGDANEPEVVPYMAFKEEAVLGNHALSLDMLDLWLKDVDDDKAKETVQSFSSEIKTEAEGDSAHTQAVQSPYENLAESKPFFRNYKIIGQLFYTYWIIEQNGSMYIIDQHAAHERTLYEDFLQKFRSNHVTSQRLLSPAAIKLNQTEYQTVQDHMELLESFGFEIEEFGDNTFALRAVPFIFNNPTDTGFFIDIIDMLANADTAIENIYDVKLDAIAKISCKAAVKGNDKLDYLQAKALIESVLKLEHPFTCPHGRPTIIEITKYELEKKFKRIV